MVEPERLVAEPRHHVERMRYEEHRTTAATEVGELVQTFVGERLIAHRENLVHQEHIRIDVDRDGKAEAHVHARTSTS